MEIIPILPVKFFGCPSMKLTILFTNSYLRLLASSLLARKKGGGGGGKGDNGYDISYGVGMKINVFWSAR